MITQLDLIYFANKINPTVWYTPSEFERRMCIDTKLRRSVVPHLKKRKIITTRGKTSKIQYRLTPPAGWKVNDSLKHMITKPIEPTGNGVIDAKLRKEANLPEDFTPLEALIAAASAVGTQNEILQGKLQRIKAILEEVV